MTDHAQPTARALYKDADGKLIEVAALWESQKVLFTGNFTVPPGFREGDKFNVFVVKNKPRDAQPNGAGNGASRPVERPAPAGRKVARAPR